MGISYNTSIVRDGLVLHLDAANTKSYTGSGTVWKDLSGNGNDGTLVNGVGYSADNKGAMVFDGVNDRVSLSAVNSNYFSAQFWVKYSNFKSGNAGYATISNASSTNNGFMIYQATSSPYNRLTAFVCTPSITSVASITLLSTNTWYNFTVTYDGSFIKIYLNSALDNSVAKTGFMTPNPVWLNIGRVYYNNSYFAGSISNVQIYNRALSAAEIQQNFNATRGRYGI